MIDALRLSELPREPALKITSRAIGFECGICGAKQEADAWRVYLPKSHGPACPGCAADAGWVVR